MASQEMVLATAILLVAYCGVILYFVYQGARKNRSMADYALGSVQFSPITVGLSLAASITSAATFIINPGFIALYGVSGILAMGIVLPLGLFISLVILTKSFRKHGATVKALTMAQWIGKRYGSSGFSLYVAFLSLLLITFIVLICVGMTKVLANALNVQELYVLIGIVGFVFGYMMFGGANSMVYTNTIQAVLMIIVAVILLGSGYEHFSRGVHGFIDKLNAIDPVLTQATNPSSFLFRDFFEVIFCNFIVGIAIVCQPHIITKSLLLREERDVNKYLITAILVETLFFLVVIAGLYARLSFPDLKANGAALSVDGIIPAYVVQEFPVYVGLLVIMGLLSAGLSTLEGLIQSVSTTITSDIIEPLFGQHYGEGETRSKRLFFTNRTVIIALGGIAIMLSWYQLVSPSLSVGIFAQNGVYAYFSAAFVPVLFGIFVKEAPRAAPVLASIAAIVVHFSIYYGGLTEYMKGPVRNPAIAAALAILSSVLVGLVVLAWYQMKKMRAMKSLTLLLLPLFALFGTTMFATSAKNTIDLQHNPIMTTDSLTKFAKLSNGIQIAYTEAGAGSKTLLFIHGLGSNKKSWQKNIATLKDRYRCIALDLPGYEESSKGAYPFSMHFFAETVIEFIRHLKLEQVTLVGHSMGGQVSTTLALAQPDLIEKLILIAPAGFETFSEAEKNWFKAVYTPAVVKGTSVEQIRKNFEINFFAFPQDAAFMIEDRLKLREMPDAYDYYCNMVPQNVFAMLDEPVYERLQNIKTPTLIIYGANDQLIPNQLLHKGLTVFEVARKGHFKIPGSKLAILANSGHFVQWEQAGAANEVIVEFVE